jgi:hypothetical protein
MTIAQGTFGRGELEMRWRRHWELCVKTGWAMDGKRKGPGIEGHLHAATTAREHSTNERKRRGRFEWVLQLVWSCLPKQPESHQSLG